MNLSTTTATVATPKGVTLGKKIQTRDEVVGKLPNVLVSGFGIRYDVAGIIAPAVYDGYVAALGGVPANVECVRNVLRTPQGRAQLDHMVEEAKAKMAIDKPAPAPVTTKAPAPVEVEKTLDAATQERLTTQLRAARMAHLQSSKKRDSREDGILDAVLTEIVFACMAQGVTFFVTPYANFYPAQGVLIGRLRALQEAKAVGKFFLRATEDGLHDEVIDKPKAKPGNKPFIAKKVVTSKPMLPEHVQGILTALLREAVRIDAYGPIDRALRHIVSACQAAGVKEFRTPYVEGTETAGLLIKRMMRLEEKVYLKWTEDGLKDEKSLEATAPATVRKTAPDAKAQRAKKLADRREADADYRSAHKGKTGEQNSGGKPNGKPGKGKK